MQFFYLLVTAVALYLLSDWLLRRIEARLGHQLEHRSLIFFAMLLGSLLVGFTLIRHLLSA